MRRHETNVVPLRPNRNTTEASAVDGQHETVAALARASRVLGLTKTAAAKRLGVSARHMGRWRNGLSDVNVATLCQDPEFAKQFCRELLSLLEEQFPANDVAKAA